MKFIKFIYVIEDISVIGGRESMVLSKSSCLAGLGYDVTIISHNIKNKKKHLTNKVSYVNLNIEKNKLSKSNFNNNLKTQLENEFFNIQPDFVIFLCGAGLNAYTKVNTSAKMLIEVHGGYDFYRYGANRKKSIARNFNKKVKFYSLKIKLQKFDSCVFLSRSDNIKWNIKNSIVIPNFIPSEQIAKPCDIYTKKNNYIAAGRLSFEKGFDRLIHTWHQVNMLNKELKLDIYGSGPEEESIVDLIKKYQLEDTVTIHPFTDKLLERLNNYSAFILPSRNESFGLVILESMSQGVPVISFNIDGGVQDLITNNVDGILSPQDDINSLRDAILDMSNYELRKHLSRNTYKKANKFSSNTIIPLWVNHFNELSSRD
ncbi:MAG: glycosyltransferase [Shewanella sp.]